MNGYRSLTVAARYRVFVVIMLAAVVAALPGCNVVGWIAHGTAGSKQVQVKAQYAKLDHHSIAVMVSAADVTLFHYPDAPLGICRAVSRRLAEHLKGVTLMKPEQVIAFQQNNPYWTAMRYSQLVKKMGVDRLVIIDLNDYRTHRPGNTHVWKGVIDANIGVVSKDAADPDNFVFYQHVRVEFPPDNPVGVVEADNQTMQLGMDNLFAQEAAGLFYDHEEAAK